MIKLWRYYYASGVLHLNRDGGVKCVTDFTCAISVLGIRCTSYEFLSTFIVCLLYFCIYLPPTHIFPHHSIPFFALDMLLPEAGQAAILNEPSELYLLESVGLMTSHALQGSSVTAAPQLLVDMVGMVVKQIGALLHHPQRDQYPKEVGDAVAHKVASLGSLARGHRPGSGTAATAPTAAVAGPVFLETAEAVASVMEDMGAHPSVRVKCMVFIHRVVNILGATILPYAGRCLAKYLETATVTDVDQAITLLNQLIESFTAQAMYVVDGFLGPILDKLTELHGVAGTQGMTETQTAADRLALQKLSISFIQHISASPCVGVLVSARNSPRLSTILDSVMATLTGVGGGTAVASAPLRRCALGTLTNLVKAWGSGSGSGGGDALAVDPALKARLVTVIREQALPAILVYCQSESNARDALTLSLYADVGSLFYAVGQDQNNDEFCNFLAMQLLPSLSWPPEPIAQLCALQSKAKVGAGTNLADFREKFKAMLKSFRQ